MWLCLFSNPALAQTTIIGDTFTSANGIPLTAHAPETNPLSRAWAVTGSPSPTLQNNRAAVTSGSNYVTAFIDGGTPDATVSTTFVAGANPAAGSNMAALVFRRIDANNYFFFRRYNYGVSLWCVANGTWTLLASETLDQDLAPGSTHTLTAILSGSTIRALWDNGVRVLTVSNATHIAATQYGVLWLPSYDSVTTYDYFGVTGVLAAPTHHTDVTPGQGSVLFQEGVNLTAAAKDANNAVVPNTAFTWSTSNPAIASVTATSATTARVVGTGVGRVTITATPTRGGAGASAVTVNPGNFILFDDFSGTDATALAAHAPTVNLVAAAWAVTGSPVPFLSAQTAAVTGGSSTVTAMTDAGIPDVLVETDWSPGSNPAGGMSNGALVFRRTDANNYFMLQWSNGRLILWRVAAGAWTNRWQANFDSSILTGTHHLSAQATGSSIQVMWDRGVYIGNVTDNFNISATQAGLQWSAIYDSRATYDNFSIRGSLPAWATSVTVTPSPPNVVFHEGTTLTAHAYDAVGAPITNMAFTWATSDANVFQVAPTAAATAFITAVGPGSATITATPTHGPNGSTVASVNLGTYVVYDSFSASGGTLLTAHAPEVNRPGGAWTVTGGPAPSVASQRAGVASGSSTVTATIEGWIPNVTASVLWTPAANPTGGSNYAGLVFRRSDADNYFLLRYWNGWLQLWRVCDGASTQIWASQFDEEPALQSHPIAVQLTGPQIQVLWDNALLATVTDPFNITATQYGLQWSSLYDATSTYDNFSITGTLPPVPTRVVVTPANPAIGFNTGRWAEAHAYDAVGAEIPGVVFRWSSSAPTIVVATAQTANTGYLVGIGTGSSTITAQATRGGPIGSTTATVDLGSTLVYDSFQGSNGANLTTHVPEVAQLGGSWKVTGGNGASLSGGRAVASTTTSADIVIALFETSMPNGTLDVLWRSAASIPANAFGGVVFRATDSLNYFYLEYWGQTVQLWKRTPARFEHVAGSDVGDAGLAAHHLGATFVGATIQVKWDGVLLFTANDAFNQGATSAGLVWFPIYDPNASYDTFSVAGTLPPPVATMNVTPLQTSFAPYSTQTLTATTLDGGAQPIADAAVKFVSSDNAVATVVQTGPRTALVTAIANGSVTITTSVPRGPAPVSRTTTVSTCVDPLATPTITWDYQARTGATVAVTAPAGCSWTAFSLDSWLSVTGGAAGTGNRTVTYTFSENVGSARTGRLILGGRVYSIIQPAKPCHMDLSPDTANVGSGGGTLSFDVSTTGSCAWTAFVAQPAAWLHASSSGTGVGTITVDVDSYDNTSEPRVGAIHVGDATFVVTQNVASGACSYGVSPGSAAWGGNGGQGAIAVSASSACAWTASSNSTWVTLSATAGAGNTMLGYTVAPNLFPNVRTATLTVGTAMFVVTQNVVGTTGGSVSGDGSGGSTILVTPVIVQVPERWRSGSLALLTAAGNSWQAWSMSPWLSLDRQTGTGRATLWYKAAANPGTEDRIGTIVVTDAVDSQTVFIVQHGGSWRITKTNECLDCTDPYPPDCDPTDDGWSGGGSGDPWCEDAPEGTDDPHCNGSPRAPKVLVMQAFGNADYCVDPAPTGPPPAPHTGIFAQAHSAVALTPFEHLSLRIIPQNQTWVQLRPSYFRRDPADGLWFSTIGAGPGPNADVGRCFGTLTSDVNRDSDVNDPILFFERLQYGNGFASSIVEDVLIQDFFRRALKENGGYQNNLAYVCLPSAFAGDFTYNSNSFFAGLLDVVHIFPRPAFATSQAWRFPGFNKPVPTQWFGQ